MQACLELPASAFQCKPVLDSRIDPAQKQPVLFWSCSDPAQKQACLVLIVFWPGVAGTAVRFARWQVNRSNGNMPVTIRCPHCQALLDLPKPHQLVGQGVCPRCGNTITPHDLAEEEQPPFWKPTTHWWDNSVSFLTSIVFHTALILLLALWTYGGS
jgi:hypothetical protein